MNRALVLSGGSIKGAFQAGAISHLLQRGFVPDSIYGVSVGSLNGAFLADRAGKAVIRSTKPLWPKIGLELEQFWKKRISSPDKIGKKRLLHSVLSIFFKNFKGMMDTTPLKQLIINEFRKEHIQNSPAKFTAGVVNLTDGKYITAPHTHRHILKYIIASTAIPMMMPIVSIEQQQLLDGGMRNIAPLKQAIDDNATEIICILTHSRDVSKEEFDSKDPLQLVDRILEIISNEILTNDIAWAQYINTFCPKDGTPVAKGPFKGYRYIPITVIRPEHSLNVTISNFTARDVHNLLILGDLTAKTVL